MTISGPNAAEQRNSSPSGRLRNMVERWERLDTKIKEFADDPAVEAGLDVDSPLSRMRERRRKLADEIFALVGRHPALADEAVDWGFSHEDFNPEDFTGPTGVNAGEERGRENDRPSTGPSNTTGPATAPTGRPRNRGGGGGGGNATVDGDLLPGERGKHFDVVRYNGQTYIVYTVKIGNRSVQTSWRVKPGDLDKHNLEEGDGRQITKAQFKKLQIFGTTDQIVRRKGGNKHPFKKWIEEVDAIYGGTSILKNKETLGILVAGFLEREDPAITEGKLRNTKWYQNRTAFEREWEMVKTEAEREQTLKRTTQDIKLALDDLYGNVNWRKYVDEEDVEKWALKVASGKWDDPGAALNSLISRQARKAEKVEGTAAWQAKQEEAIAGREFANRPEEIFEQLREDAIYQLGYQGRFDKATLQQWAKDIAFQRKTEAQWQQYVRKTKQSLYKYLDPDEAFMDRQAIYKGIAEDVLGRPLSAQDRLFSDFTATKPDGTPIADGTKAMSTWDFEKKVRADPRFGKSRVAHDEAFSMLGRLDALFTGRAA